VKKITRSAFGIASVVFIATTFLVVLGFAADAPTTVTNIFKPLSTPAQAIHDVSMLAIAICAGIFLVVGGLLAYTVVRFRQRPGDDGDAVAEDQRGDQGPDEDLREASTA